MTSILFKNITNLPRVQMLSSWEMDWETQVQILDKVDCVLHRSDTLGKSMNLIPLPPAMGKIVGQTDKATSLGEGRFWIQTSF